MEMKLFKSLCVFTVAFVIVESSIYSESSNQKDVKKFKMKKVQMVWEKAQKNLNEHQQADLYADLLVHDKAEKRLKKIKAIGEDEDGLIEAETREAFADIVEKHGLERFFPTDRRTGHRTAGTGESKTIQLKDEKLRGLWKKAELEGFTDKELETLKEEFSHHQMKLEEFKALGEELKTLQDKDNSLEDLDKDDGHWRKLAETNRAMKDKHKELKENMRSLEERTSNPDKRTIFQDPRVYQLWALAKKSNMSAADLTSFKEELTHFANRIKKHEHIQEQLRNHPIENSIEPEKHLRRDQLREKAEMYQMKVDKYHADLTDRVKRALKHTEL